MPVKKKELIKGAPIAIRLPPDTKAALEKAARDDDRPLATMAQRIITDWLKDRKYLK